MQPVQVTPQKIKGKLHSEFGSAPDVVGQVGELLDVGGGGGRPEDEEQQVVPSLFKPDAAVQLMLHPVDVAALFVTNKISTLFVLMGMSNIYLNWYCQ